MPQKRGKDGRQQKQFPFLTGRTASERRPPTSTRSKDTGENAPVFSSEMRGAPAENTFFNEIYPFSERTTALPLEKRVFLRDILCFTQKEIGSFDRALKKR